MPIQITVKEMWKKTTKAGKPFIKVLAKEDKKYYSYFGKMSSITNEIKEGSEMSIETEHTDNGDFNNITKIISILPSNKTTIADMAMKEMANNSQMPIAEEVVSARVKKAIEIAQSDVPDVLKYADGLTFVTEILHQLSSSEWLEMEKKKIRRG